MATMQSSSGPGGSTPHYNVSCQNCRVSKTFLTLQGVNSFVLEHDGHNVIEGRLFERPQMAKKAEPVPEAPKPQEFEVPAQQVTVAPAKVVVQEGEMQVEEPIVVTSEVIAPSVEVVQELEPQVEDSAVPVEEAAQELSPLMEERIAPVEIALEEPAPQVNVVETQPPVHEEEPVPLPQIALPVEAEQKNPVAVTPPQLSEMDLKEPLLLARSSYIGESTEKRIDALKVSRALKEFKWNVEPPYVIGVMVDDNLSVESNIGVISNTMVDRVEKLGYKFVAVNSPQGSPVAWFKKEAKETPGTSLSVADPERTMQISRGRRTYDQDKAVWEESFVSLLMTVKDMDGQKLKQVTDSIKSERPEPDLHA